MLHKQTQKKLERYLSSLYQKEVHIHSTEEIGKQEAREMKSFGYGKPHLITYSINRRRKSAVLETMSENSFGHDHFSDRAQCLLWQYSAFGKLPGHVRAIDVGAFTAGKEIISVGEAEEFFLLTEFVEGEEYSKDLERILSTEKVRPLDLRRAEALARYLVRIHQLKRDAPHLYARRIRDLLGHGECIMGLIDNFPANDDVAGQKRLQNIEERCLQWRWKLKSMSYRLCQVHGDFHPWNVLFQRGTAFTVLDRSRGEWGEAADDVSSMTINYLFFALQKHNSLKGPFLELYRTFWNTYLEETRDLEILRIVPPFLAWRGLVLGNPVWYPALAGGIRKKLFHWIEAVLSLDEFQPERTNEYLG